MITWKLLLVAVATSTQPAPAQTPPANPKVETFRTYDACEQAAILYRRVPGVGAKCIPDGEQYQQPHLVYRGPAPLPRPPYGAVPVQNGGYVYPLPPLPPPQGPAPWPQDY